MYGIWNNILLNISSASQIMEKFLGELKFQGELLYCMKILRHKKFAVSRSSSRNREIKMPQKMF